MLQKLFGESSVGERVIYKWYKHFQDCRKSVEDDDDRVGLPSTSRNVLITAKIQLEKLLKKLIYRMVHAKKFY